jgi:hypothetical protein
MKRKPIVQLDQVLREDQLAHLAEHAISGGLAVDNRRRNHYEDGKPRPKRGAPTQVSKILEDLGMTLPAAASRLLKKERTTREAGKKPPTASAPAIGLKSRRKL